jgi:hypothetical protein
MYASLYKGQFTEWWNSKPPELSKAASPEGSNYNHAGAK